MILSGIPALEEWCRRVTSGYAGVNIVNLTESWRSGLAFCAIIARFRPDLIDFVRLEDGQIFRNCSLAFSIADEHLGIPSLLDPTDMVEKEQLDRHSMITYLAQFYHKFGDQSPKPAARGSLAQDNLSEANVAKDSGLDDSSKSSRQSSPAFSSSSYQLIVKSSVPPIRPETERNDKVHPALTNIKEMLPRAKVFSYLKKSSPKYLLINKGEESYKFPWDHLKEKQMISTDKSSEISTSSTSKFSPVSPALSTNRKNIKHINLSKHQSYESLVNDKSPNDKRNRMDHKTVKNSTFTEMLQKFNSLSTSNRTKTESYKHKDKSNKSQLKSSETQTEEISPTNNKLNPKASQGTQTGESQMSPTHFKDNEDCNIKTASSSSISALYSRMPNFAKRYPTVRGNRDEHILGYSPMNSTKSKVRVYNNLLNCKTANYAQLRRNMSHDNICYGNSEHSPVYKSYYIGNNQTNKLLSTLV